MNNIKVKLLRAKKLLAGEPLKKILPVDEYLPIMFNKHPEERWSNAFSNRNLKAFSVSPLFVYPTRYTGEEGYISDTEDSNILSKQLIEAKNSQGHQSSTAELSAEEIATSSNDSSISATDASGLRLSAIIDAERL